MVVVRQQSSVKSALLEALIGFQFNQVGGCIKTHHPIALHRHYNLRCTVASPPLSVLLLLASGGK